MATKKYTPDDIKAATLFIQAEAEKRRMDAGYGGLHTDGGASDLLSRLEIFTTMWDGGPLIESRIPPFMRPDVERARLVLDSEWGEYQRLKEKFGGA
jgi:hypothetical protein